MKKKKSRRTPARKAVRVRKGPGPNHRGRAPAEGVAGEFQQAFELATKGFLFDAIQAFEKVARDDRNGEFADDALFNQGLCYMRMNLFHDAIAAFSRVIQGYPDASISATAGGHERGRTAAKALLGRVRCRLALGDSSGAAKDLEELRAYDDSFVTDDEGRRRTFHDLAREALDASEAARRRK